MMELKSLKSWDIFPLKGYLYVVLQVVAGGVTAVVPQILPRLVGLNKQVIHLHHSNKVWAPCSVLKEILRCKGCDCDILQYN